MHSRSALFPGYSQVERFETEDEYVRNEAGELAEEVSFVTLDVGNVEPTLLPSSSTYRLIVSPLAACRRQSPHVGLAVDGCAYTLGSRHCSSVSSTLRDCIPGSPREPHRHRASLYGRQGRVTIRS
jgi:hypothetical protein